ncbi:MAG: LPS export ABC transporter periplasmic protein LptC [Muribaculaceae bacterium]|nr:LPS export ABC transporter periplasmic protein LptC [Muribaculaceae bacterium]
MIYRHRLHLLPATVAAALCAAAVTACGSGQTDTEPVPVDGNVTPTLVTDDVSTLISDSGYTRYHLVTQKWLMFENADEPNWKFPSGLFLEKYDDDMNQDATIVSDSATYFSAKKLWRLDGNVRMRNTAGDRFLTQQLFWDQNAHSVYSDSFIHIERADRTIEGYGFVSNEQMTTYTITDPTGIFPVSDFRGGDNAEAPADTAAPAAPDTVTPPRTRRQSTPRRPMQSQTNATSRS